MAYIVYWFALSFSAGLLAYFLARAKNRDYSSWAAWCFLVPPLILALILTPKNAGPAPQRRRLSDDGDPETF
ncbi:MAG: hypothetical protein NW216_03125 [Hyphomicrobium sp.]|nr:hypothetical protein [Hyphomicrobium sp.]